ncbi:hypothetical protein BCR33DRAFT_210839 [Rhizoclosmatium globosum]|uniref:ER membrane protein complex subunit 2 n=1 Tax=Rhizoclosmatium globosum TaxID=329046 RepID=A0A1Y2CCP7_9FUNG|nr:hypothetical protein BCR33DRAFT_210839 [Rhizoclosmatium globosum]|eukprot:ORY44831.1 hypothetical protein BCR33DRAFT_210839 [Rhizoclosmatium globosum]
MPGSESGVMFGSEAAGRVSSNEVFVAGTSLLAAHAFGHEAERLSQIEQVFVAALETGRIDDAAIRLNDLEKEFPTTTNKDGNIVFASLRVAKLQGMLLEAKAEFDKALALYEKALAQDETYAPIIKRKVAVLIDQGKSNVAITTLVHYLDHFHADLEAWTTLSNLYLRANMFQQAAFALEECMILGGFNFLYHIRYAELNMTLGKYPVALKYFCSAVEVTERVGARCARGMDCVK